MNTMDTLSDYSTIGWFLLGGLAFVGFNFLLASLLTRLLKYYRPTPSKQLTYECGEAPESEAWIQYNVRYYVFAMLFVLFDVEMAFLVPWAVGYKQMLPELGIFALVEACVFIFFLALALLYAWKKGALEWV